ncbi:MAG: PTS galactosamine transporter subunit IIB [Bacillota bacterium]|jgi:PTS system galactosamine-specific IIB component|nr:PTS galactosamine transporter subunit IIB [Bacillota bacterium]NLL26718.1 PTS N-acetylgalactosamine transporter subunit IIB [Erysipelotrichia bacterium]
MRKPNILMTRIDNRLVHGQVGVAWINSLGANLIIVADDDAANDPVQQSVMSITADIARVGIRFFSIDKTIETVWKASPKQLIYLVVRDPQSARRLVDGGLPLDKINVANMHFEEGKRAHPGSPYVYVDDQDLEDFEAMKAKGVSLFIQILPGDKIYNI